MKTLTALLLLVPTLALAQTTQPVYIRPSKGAPIPLTLAANTPSVIFDFSAFNAAQVTFTEVSGGVTRRGSYAVDNLNQYVRFRLFVSGVPGERDVIATDTSPTKDAPSFSPARAQNGLQTLFLCSGCSSVSIVVTPLPLSPNTGVTGLYQAGQPITDTSPFYPVTTGGLYNYWDGAGTGAYFNKAQYSDMVEIDYPVIKESSPLQFADANRYGIFVGSQNITVGNTQRGGTVVAVAALAGNTTVFDGSNYVSGNREWSRNVSIQNVGTVPVLCGTAGTITTSNYQTALSAGLANNDGKGGRYEFAALRLNATIKCAGDGGAGRVAIEHW